MKIQLSHRKDRKYLVTLADSLKISTKNLVRDELEYWNIKGSKGFINTDSLSWYVYVEGRSLENRLSFMEIRMNGLSFRLDRMPTEEEAEIIRNVVGLKKKREMSEEHRAVLRNRLKELHKKGVNGVTGALK